MSRPLYDLAANEAEMRRASAAAAEAASDPSQDADDRLFVEVQVRLTDLLVLSRIEAMRAVNEGRSREMVVAAMAIKMGTALWNIADMEGADATELAADFCQVVHDTVLRIDALHGVEGMADEEGVLTRTTEILAPEVVH